MVSGKIWLSDPKHTYGVNICKTKVIRDIAKNITDAFMCLYVCDGMCMVFPKCLHSFIQQTGSIPKVSLSWQEKHRQETHWNRVRHTWRILNIKGLARGFMTSTVTQGHALKRVLALGFNALQSLSWDNFIFVFVFCKWSSVGQRSMHSRLGASARVWSCLSLPSGDRFTATRSPAPRCPRSYPAAPSLLLGHDPPLAQAGTWM